MMAKFTYIVLFVCFSIQGVCWGYNLPKSYQRIDSLLKASRRHVYENPDKSIELGVSIYNNEHYSIKTRVRALMLMTLAYTSKRDYQSALAYIIKANALSKDIDDKVLQIQILFRTGILYQQLKIFDKSIDYLEETEELALLYPVRDSVGKHLANSYIVKGFIYKDNLNCDIALEYFDKGIKEYERLKREEVNANLSIAYYNRGNCYTLLSEYKAAKNSFQKSIAFAQLENANSLIAFAQKGLAEVYTQEGEYEKAINLLQTAYHKSKTVGDLVLNLGIYNGLFENYLALNQWEAYQKYYELYSKTQLEIKVSERNSISASIEESHKVQNQDLNLLKLQYKEQLYWILILIFIIILGVLFIERKNRTAIKLLKSKLKSVQNQKQS